MTDPAPKSDDEAEAVEAARRLIATVAANPTKQKPEPPPRSQPAKIYQLPLWPDPVRGAPNSFLRSALFAAIQGKGRKQMKRELLSSIQGVTVRYTGEQLDQSDLDVWEQAIHLSRRHPLGNVCHFTGYAFLKSLGRNTGTADYEWLHNTITRLVACAVEIRLDQKVFTGSLLYNCERDEASSNYKLTLDPKTVQLYGWNDWTALDWNQRTALRRKPLALWLHGFYSTHAAPFPIKVETLHQLSGSTTKNLHHFKANLKIALSDLEAATGIKGTIDGDLVTVERHGTRAQQRHLRRRSAQQDAATGQQRRHRKSQQKLALNWKRIGNLV